jgi:menaquinol-cytochrome c reductase iron-sulfur subunit
VPVVEPQSVEGTTRRTFYIGGIFAMLGAILAALGIPALAYLFFPPKLRKEQQWVEAGDITKLAPNSPVALVFRRNRVDGWKITSEKGTAWVVKRPDNSVVAFGPECTHLGCAYHWEEGKGDFLCPCHTSVFAIDGRVLSGPAQRPLDRFDVKVEGNKLLIGNLRKPEEQNG